MPLKKLVSVVLILSFLILKSSAFALLSLEEEEKLGREILQEAVRNVEFIKDIEVIAYVNLIGETLVKRGVTFSPFNFRFYVVRDRTFNAFSVPGGYIFLNTGLFLFLESEDELAGVLAHEMAHNLARHVAKRLETIRRMQIATTTATLTALILGGPQTAQIVGATGTALAQTKLLAYSRQDEEEADRIGFEILTKAGYNPQAMVRVFEKLSRESSFSIELNYRYLLTHPLPQERLNYLQNLVERAGVPLRDRYLVSQDPDYYKRIRARVRALSEESSDLIPSLRLQLREKEDPWLRYTLAIALLQARFFSDAEKELDLALRALPQRLYFKLDFAELKFLQGRYEEALRILETLRFEGSPLNRPLELKRKLLLARALFEVGMLKESYSIFKSLEDENFIEQEPTFFYFFGILCSRLDLMGEAHFYFGKHHENKGDLRVALFHYRRALSFLPKDTKMYSEAERKVKTFEKKEERKK